MPASKAARDPWADSIETAVRGRPVVTTGDLMTWLGLPAGRQTRQAVIRIATHLKAMGWQRTEKRIDGRPRKCFVRPE